MIKRFTVTELTLVGFNRLALSKSKNITITPKSIHLILGTNGSGKSSIMELWTPLPPDRKDFTPDGYKAIKFTLDTDSYHIHSASNKHTIYKNNELVLENCGNKQLLEYCKEYFNITPNLHRFMLGKTKFTDMSMQDRKNFLTEVSNIDYDYVNKVYNNSKKKLRDNQAILRHLNSKMLAMKDFILKEEEITKLREDSNKLTDVIHNLYSMTSNKLKYVEVDRVTVNSLVYRTKNRISQSYYKDYKKDYFNIKEDITLLKNEIKSLTQTRDSISDKLNKLSETVSNEEVKEKIKEYNKLIQEFTNDRVLDTDRDILKTLEDKVNRNLHMSLLYMIKTLHEDLYYIKNTSKKEILEYEDNHKEKLNKIENELTLLYGKLDQYAELKSKYKNISTDLKCSHCNTPILNPTVLKSMNQIDSDRAKVTDRIRLLKEDKKTLEDEYIDNINLLNKIQRILEMSGLDKYINLDKDLLEQFNIFVQLDYDIKHHNEYIIVKDKLEHLNSLEVSDDKKTLITKYENEYDVLNNLIIDKNKQLKLEIDKINLVDKIDDSILLIKKHVRDLNNNKRYELLQNKCNYINSIINVLKDEKNTINESIDKYNHNIKEESDTSKEITNIEYEIKMLNILLESLSPSTGLIADSLQTFIFKFMDEVNDIINNVWSYKMKVLPLQDDKGMTYKFPIKVENNSPKDDIKDGSDSMKEIINLAFRLVSLNYLGLQYYPLLIDEYGRSMDEVHLIKTYDLLEHISEENNIQMLIIAHIKSAYSRFTNAGIDIISKLNYH